MSKIKLHHNERAWISKVINKNIINDQKFYNSTLWKHTRLKVLEAQPLCVYCLYEHKYNTANTVDHIIRIQKGGSKTNPDNLQSLCTSHHNTKSSFEGRGLYDSITIALHSDKVYDIGYEYDGDGDGGDSGSIL